MGIAEKPDGSPRQGPIESGLISVEKLAVRISREKTTTAGWDLNVTILAYAVLAAVVLLSFAGVATEVVALVAILGLATVWVMGWRRRKHLFRRFYDEELHQLQELSWGKEAGPSIPSPITSRETEILSYIACGYTNKQIAHKLGISEQTIKNHMSSIMRKMDANDRTQAVVLAIKHGWLSSQVIEALEPNNKQ